MKIKSITDVITNSSTEVFILDTDKSLKEVSDILKEITEGYMEPEIIEKQGDILTWLQDYGYLYDPDDKESMEKYYLSYLGNEGTYFDYTLLKEVEIPGAKELNEAWVEYLYSKKDEINEHFRSISGRERDLIIEERNPWWMLYYPQYLPKNTVEDFLSSYQKPLPEYIQNLPKELDINTYIGKIGFQGVGSNSIPFETWETILDNFGGRNWHLG